MLTVKQCRTILGKKYENYTDEQIEMIRDWMYNFVRITKEGREKKLDKLIQEEIQRNQDSSTETKDLDE